MATILNNAAYMALPMNIKRGNPIPLDTTAVWYSKSDLETYAASGATAYVGQVLTLVTDSKCEAYMISNEAGTLIKLASTTASGDLASDVATLQTQVTGLISKVGKAAEGEDAATGLFALIDEVKALANAKVASVEAADKSITIGGTATAPIVKVAISAGEDNALSLADDGLKVVVPDVTHPEYTIAKKTDAGDYAAVYQLTKDGVAVGVDINIPKDIVVKSGSVQTYEAGSLPTGVPEAGTYLVLTLANATSDKVYINVSDLIEYVTGTEASDGIITTAVDANHVLTATIGDGKITKTKLASAVQTSLDKADTALQTADLTDYAKTADVASGYVAKNGTDRLMTAAEGTKLTGIAEGAQVNVIEAVKVGGVALDIADKAVDITEISTDLLKQGDMTLILKGGNAAILAQG